MIPYVIIGTGIESVMRSILSQKFLVLTFWMVPIVVRKCLYPSISLRQYLVSRSLSEALHLSDNELHDDQCSSTELDSMLRTFERAILKDRTKRIGQWAPTIAIQPNHIHRNISTAWNAMLQQCIDLVRLFFIFIFDIWFWLFVSLYSKIVARIMSCISFRSI
jgi:hypothetical protein